MPTLAEQIFEAIADNRYIISVHANVRLREREIDGWQIIAGAPEGKLLVERLDADPNPVIELEQLLSDGTPVKAVWAWLEPDHAAKLVTVHFFDR